MIGGYDIVFESNADPEDALRTAYRLLAYLWPHAVVEDGVTGELLSAGTPFDAFSGRSAIMVYRDSDARDSWDAYEAEPINHNTMIHVLAGPGGATLVVDNPNDPIAKQVIQGMRTFLTDNIFHITAEGRAAA